MIPLWRQCITLPPSLPPFEPPSRADDGQKRQGVVLGRRGLRKCR